MKSMQRESSQVSEAAHAPAVLATPGVAAGSGLGASGARSARLGAATPLRFEAPDPGRDLPGHVRAGSGLRWFEGQLVVVQDDVNALARVAWRRDLGGPETATPLVLPAGPGGLRHFSAARGNKADKLDLESCAVLPDGRLLVLPSGSTPARERLVVVAPGGTPVVHDGAPFFAALRGRVDFAGHSLNLEGVAVSHDQLWLFQRGNGARPAEGASDAAPGRTGCGARRTPGPVSAVGRLPLAAFLAWLDGAAAVPTLDRVWPVDLGSAGGVAYGFTDAAPLPDGRIAFLAGAEDSPDTFHDGAVLGARIGLLSPEALPAPGPARDDSAAASGAKPDEGAVVQPAGTRSSGAVGPGGARSGGAVELADIVGPDGQPTALKLEGLVFDRVTEDGALSFLVVADMDDPEVPALIAPLVWAPED